jgi:hypothetical protein
MIQACVGRWLVVAALLADIGPHCGSDPPNPTTLEVTTSTCNCVMSIPVTVTVDNVEAGKFTCGAYASVKVEVTPGSHQVSAACSQGTWSARTVQATAGETTLVDLGCPSQ